MDREQPAKAVSPDDICPKFIRIPESLIEEPEVCEWCQFYRSGYCVVDAERRDK
jgi:hypothetical protein